MFSVAVTDASSSRMRAPFSAPFSASVLRPTDAFAPSARKPAMCVSRRRWPIASPPGGGSEARPSRARSGPAKRKLVRIFAASSGEMRADFTFAATSVTASVFASRVTRTPNVFATSSIRATSSIAGTLCRTTGSDVRSAAAIIGSAAFLFPETRCVPEIA